MTARVARNLLILIGLVAAGTMGYTLIEGWHWFDALYMTIITLSTIGYGETHPMSQFGRGFTILLIVGGGGIYVFLLSDVVRMIVSGEVRENLERRRMKHLLKQMENHIIVCGYGRVGRLVCREFMREKVPFVIVDRNAEALTHFDLEFGVPLVGDATSDEVLRKAGIERARGLVTVIASDADNLYTTMSARLLNSKLFIVARMEEAHSEEKLRRAGANRVVSPYHIGGSRVVHAVLRPTVVDFIELATRTEHIDLQMEESKIAANSPLVGQSLKDSHLRADLKIIIMAIKKTSGHMQFNPDPDTLLEQGDILVAIGHRDQLTKLDALASPPR